METCRLCLRHTELIELSTNIVEETLSTLQQFLPRLNNYIIQNPMLCEICLDDTKVVSTLMKNVNENEDKIMKTMDTDLDKKLHIPQCRICLTPVKQPEIFLYENTRNILSFDLLRRMLEFCSIFLNFELSERPVMCIDCWKHLQISYSFKKSYMETNRKITLYCTLYKISIEDLKDESFFEILKFYENDDPPDLKPVEISPGTVEKSQSLSANAYDNSMICSSDSEYLENKDDVKKEIKQELIDYNPSQPRRQRNKFKVEDDTILMKNYYQITKVEKEFKFGYWQAISKIWCESRPDKPLNSKSIRNRIQAILHQRGRNVLPKVEMKRIKEEVKKEMEFIVMPKLTTPEPETYSKLAMDNSIQGTLKPIITDRILATEEKSESNNSLVQHPIDTTTSVPPPNAPNIQTTATDHESDSDDTFIDEAAPAFSSFTPQIKCEILSDDEFEEAPELDLIQPKLEVESDNESLPQLDRMDIPHMEIKIAECYSVDVKREELNMFTTNPDVNVEDLKTCRKISFKNEGNDGLFKCMQCSFETKYRFCADRHSRWHGKKTRGRRKRLYHCEHCSYRITNKLLMIEHQKMHEVCNDNDIPTLYPFTHCSEI